MSQKKRVVRSSEERGMSMEEFLALPVTVSVPKAGEAFGMSRDGAYDALARGEFPCRTIRVGRLIKVPRAELFRVLGIQEQRQAGGDAA